MALRFFIILIVSIGPIRADEIARPDRAQYALANQLREQANLEVDYDIFGGSGVFGIRRSKGKYTHWTEKLPLKDSPKFFLNQKEKKHIMVLIAKGAAEDDQTLQKHIRRIRDFLVACGYRRVTIGQATGMGGTPIYLDHTEPKK